MTLARGLDHRMGEATVTVTDGTGTPLADAVVKVEQVRHDFGFGNIGFDLVSWLGGEGDAGTHLFGGASAALAPRRWVHSS